MTSFSLITPIYSGAYLHPNEKCSFLRSATQFFNFGQKSYQIEYLDGEATLALRETAQFKPSWMGIALRVAVFFTLIIPLILFIAAATYRSLNHFEPFVPKLIPKIQVLIMKNLEIENLLKMRSVSAELKRTAESELIERLNSGKITPDDLGIKTVALLIEYFGAHANKITRIEFPCRNDPAGLSLFCRFPNLTHLNLEFCDEITDLSFLQDCPNLIHLNLESCDEIDDFSFLQYCPNLTHLNLGDCRQIDDFSFLRYCPNLTHLDLEDCRQIIDLRFLQYCPNLTDLNLGFCQQINDLSFLQHCPNLTRLALEGCRQIDDFSLLRHCPNLTQLNLALCPQIGDLSFLQCCPNLARLDLGGCDEIDNFSFLRHCPNLTQLNLRGCGQIDDFSFLRYCPHLRDLFVTGSRFTTQAEIQAFINQRSRAAR